MKRRRKPKAPADDRRQIVRELTTAGLSGDAVAATLKLGKNRLRERFALDLHAGRQKRKAEKEAAAAAELSKAERRRLEAIEASFSSDWYSEADGNDLYGGTHSVSEALQWLERMGFNKLDHW